MIRSRSRCLARVFNPCRVGPVLLVYLWIVTTVKGQAPSLPLAGYYRPGSYFPVELANASLVRADPAIATRAQEPGVVPVFGFGSVIDRVDAGDQRLPMHALNDDDRLIGCTTRDDALIAQLFPSHHIIPIDLDPTTPLPGPAIAWDSLDAVVLDSIDPNRVATLLSMGTTIAIRSDARPDNTWPWQRLADAWVLRPPVEDRPALLGENAYEPTYAWHPGRSAAGAQIIVLIAVLSSCVMLAISLWKSRWSLPALAVFAIAFVAGVFVWRAKHSEVMTITREDRVAGDIVRIDRWTYQTSPMSSRVTLRFDGITWPVFASPAHAASMQMVLECDARGNPVQFSYTIPANARMAFVTRTLLPGRNE